MGLGPLVCQHCQVVADHEYIYEHPFHKIWCRFCGETDIRDHAGLSETHWKQLEENKRRLEKFHNFVKGIDNDTKNTNNGPTGLG